MASKRTKIIVTVLWVVSFGMWVPLIDHAWALAVTAVLYAAFVVTYWRIPTKSREGDTGR